MKKWHYTVAFFISLIFAGAIFLKPLLADMIWLPVVCDYLSMISGGICCSVAVAWFIELQNKRKEQRDRECQRNFIFASVKNRLLRLCERELSELSIFYTRHVINQKVESPKQDVSLISITHKVVKLIEAIAVAEKAAEEAELARDVIVITPETIKRDEYKRKCLITSCATDYNVLHQALTEASMFYNNYYLDSLLTEQQIETLKSLERDVHDILRFGSDEHCDVDVVLTFKKMLFEDMEEYCSVLQIPKDERVQTYYCNVPFNDPNLL